MPAQLVNGLHPITQVAVSPRDYPGDKCRCMWSFNAGRKMWTLKYVDAACTWSAGPEGPHYLLAAAIHRALTRK
jgi:hypothetical protein